MNKIKMLSALPVLLLLGATVALTGCSQNSAPTITLQAEYGSGSQGQGLGLVDTENPAIYVENADFVCSTPNGFVQSGNSAFTFTPPCNTIDLNVYRVVDNNCPFYNAGGVANYVGEVWQYNNDLVFNAGGVPYNLPCGVGTVNSDLAPGTIRPGSPPPSMTLQATPGVFSQAYGMPTVTIYTDAGSVIGTATASTVSSDGSSITFSPAALSTYYTLGSVGILASNVGSNESTGSSVAALLYITNPPPPPPRSPCGNQRVCMA